jgi:hypothetical protein
MIAGKRKRQVGKDTTGVSTWQADEGAQRSASRDHAIERISMAFAAAVVEIAAEGVNDGAKREWRLPSDQGR